MIFSLEVSFFMTFTSPECFSRSVNISFGVFSLFKIASFALLESSIWESLKRSSIFASKNKTYKENISLINKGNRVLYFCSVRATLIMCLGTHLNVGLYLEIRVRN